MACLLNAPDVLDVLLEAGGAVDAADEDGETPLHLGARDGHQAIVEQLIRAGADVRRQSDYGTPLDRAAFGGNPAILAALLDAGAGDEAGAFGRTALHKAVARSHLDAARLLLRRGAAVDPVDYYGNDRTPLHEAVGPGNGELAELLLTYGANVHHRNNWGATALHMAARMGATDVATVLLRYGADPKAADRDGRTPIMELQPSPRQDEFRNLLTAGIEKPLPAPAVPDRPGRFHTDMTSSGPSARELYRQADESFAATLGHDGFMSAQDLDRRHSVFQDLRDRLNFRYQPDNDERLARDAEAVRLLTGAPAFRSAAEVAAEIGVIPFREVLRLERFRRRQEMEGRIRWLTPADDPLLVIFVSHRWERGDNPDPYGTQLTTLKRFVAAFLNVAAGLKEPREQRVRRVPTLAAHGPLQANYFVGVVAPFVDGFTGTPEELCEQLLDRVGVIYDFVSLPQSPRTKEEQAQFVRGMTAFHRAMTSTPVLVLRWPDDEYPTRSWCELEVWSAGQACVRGFPETAPVLRTDLWGRGVPLGDLAPQPGYDALAAAHSVLTSAVAAWRSKEMVTASEVAGTVLSHYHDALSQAEKRHRTPLVARPAFNAVVQNTVWKGKALETPGAVVPTSFRFWRGHRELLVTDGLDDQDFAEVIRVHMKATGIGCTDEHDLIPTGLWLLGCHEFHGSALSIFWGRCLLRYLVEGKDLRVRLFVRWTNERVHFKFADGEESIE